MCNAKRTILIAMLICVVMVPVFSAQTPRTKGKPKHPTALELLEKHHKACEKLQSYICNYEFEQHSKSVNPERRNSNGKKDKYRLVEIRWDGPGQRGKYIRNAWGDVGGHPQMQDIKKENQTHSSKMWDGKAWYQFSPSMLPGKNDLLTIMRGKTSLNLKNWSSIGTQDPFFSITKRGGILKEELAKKQIKKIKVANKTSRIGGVECYVIEATHKDGFEYNYWIDPKHDYQVAKYVSHKKAGSGDGSFPVDTDFKQIVLFSDFKKIDGKWIPMKTTVLSNTSNKQVGNAVKAKNIHKKTRVILNPDHDALRSFVPDDVTNGATVVLIKEGQRITGKFVWQNGHVVDADGNKVDLEKLDNQTTNTEK